MVALDVLTVQNPQKRIPIGDNTALTRTELSSSFWDKPPPGRSPPAGTSALPGSPAFHGWLPLSLSTTESGKKSPTPFHKRQQAGSDTLQNSPRAQSADLSPNSRSTSARLVPKHTHRVKSLSITRKSRQMVEPQSPQKTNCKALKMLVLKIIRLSKP